jgi:hypothetical protein
MKFYLNGTPEPFERSGVYSCTVEMLDDDTGEHSKHEFDVRWENRSLTIDIPNVRRGSLVEITISDGQPVWKCDYFHARARTHDLELATDDRWDWEAFLDD